MTATIVFSLPVKFKKKKDVVIASCPVLDVVTQGETVEDARNNIKEAVSLFISTCLEIGTLDAVLKECGFEAAEKTARKQSQVETIEVPIPFTIKSHSQSVCHA
ncbi:type II toxin-antitoxin system HicB family antitoxin [Candidatus Magnetominusculus dajiuhuensis]|uniref:type II toxin-antitoxin system HicB family antitoxin n=1 Tax=Candidatus Magnetominusculus dajiuhuensis TaxID=3137712 RepID=UPI003B4326AA